MSGLTITLFIVKDLDSYILLRTWKRLLPRVVRRNNVSKKLSPFFALMAGFTLLYIFIYEVDYVD